MTDEATKSDVMLGSSTNKETLRELDEGYVFSDNFPHEDYRDFEGSRINWADHLVARYVTIFSIDVLITMLSFLLGYYATAGLHWLLLSDVDLTVKDPNISGMLLVGFLPVLLINSFCAFWGHYNKRSPYWIEVRDLVKAVMYSGAVTSLILFALKMDFSRFWAISYFCLLVLTLPIGRIASRHILRRIGVWTKPAVILGDGSLAFSRARNYCSDAYLGLEVTSYVDISSDSRLRNLASLLRHRGELSVEHFGAEHERPHIIVAVEDLKSLADNKYNFDSIMSTCVSMTFIPPISGIPLYNSELIQGFRGDVATFRLHNNLKSTGAKIVKRVLDLIFCFAGILALAPIILIVIILIKIDGGPVFFGQERIGAGGRRFVCWKFRSMKTDAAKRLGALLEEDEEAKNEWERDHKLKNDPRITKIGAFLRKTSMDEIPQFWNVIKNEMSVIGPRPIVEAEISKYGSDFAHYANAQPGITGLWQISGRNDTNYAERVELDVWYVRNWSPWLDIVIAIKTVPILIFGIGAY